MCYEKPGPRCSGHTRTNFRAATAKLKAASEDFQQKRANLREARTEEAREEVRASRKAHDEALAELADATEKYKVSKEQRAVAMETWREAKKEYDSSPEGIEKNLHRSEDPNLSAEEREEAGQAALEGALTRKENTESWKAEQAKDKEAIEAIKSKIPGLENGDIGREIYKAADNSLRPAAVHFVYEKLRDADQDSDDVVNGYQYLAGNTALPVADLAELASSKHDWVRAKAAGNPNLPQKQRDELLKDDDGAVRRYAIETSTKLDKAQIERLANDDNKHVRKCLVSKFDLDEETEQRICRSDDSAKKASLAANPYLSTAAGETLSRDADKNVKSVLLQNPRISAGTIQRLARDPDMFIRRDAILTGRLSADEMDNRATDPSEHVRAAVAQKTKSPAMLSHLANDQNAEVRLRVVENPEISAHDLAMLTDDSDRNVVVGAIRSNRKLDSAKLGEIGNKHGDDTQIWIAIGEHPNATRTQREAGDMAREDAHEKWFRDHNRY